MRTLTLLVVAGAVVGCSPVKQGFVKREWSANMLELGVYPIYPPRADVQVGDVFVNQKPAVAPLDKERKEEPDQLALLFGHLPVEALQEKYYTSRPDFPGTSDPAPINSIFSGPPYTKRLQPVAFPGFFRVTATGAQAAALVPVNALPVGLAGQLSNVKSASVTIASAQSSSLPWVDIDSVLFEKGRMVIPALLDKGKTTPDATQERLRNAAARTPDAPVLVTVVSEVYYARSFDVSMHVGMDAAVAAKAALPAAASGLSLSPAASGKLDAAQSGGGRVPEAPPADNGSGGSTAAQLASGATTKVATNQSNTEATLPSTPGVSVGWSMTASGDIGLRQTYDKPIAIGYRGVTYRVDMEGRTEPDKNGIGGQKSSNPDGPPVQPTINDGDPLKGTGGIGQGKKAKP